mgnify:CR=1 FL=1
MNSRLKVFNSLSGQKDIFRPITPPHVGLYVCGPTVYSKVHLGNCRTFISFDFSCPVYYHKCGIDSECSWGCGI